MAGGVSWSPRATILVYIGSSVSQRHVWIPRSAELVMQHQLMLSCGQVFRQGLHFMRGAGTGVGSM